MITDTDFRVWQATVKVDGKPATSGDIGRLLGRTPNTIVNFRRRGVPTGDEPLMRLAMSAISNGLAPWVKP